MWNCENCISEKIQKKLNIIHFRTNEITKDICENGNFETTILDDYTFRRRQYTNGQEILCDYDTETIAFQGFNASTIPNNFANNVHATLTRATDNNGNPVYQPNILNAPNSAQISVTNNSDFAINLNNNTQPNGEGTISDPNRTLAVTMSRQFIASSSEVTFSFNFVCINPRDSININGNLVPTHPEEDQPRFRARLYNHLGVPVSEFCLVADVENTLMFHNATPGNTSSPLIYTNWQCATLSTGGTYLLPEEEREMTLEFLVNDCTQGGHFGTVYIDDICIDGCENPVFGNLELDFNNPQLGNCPAFPLEICGTYIAPHSVDDPPLFAELQSIQLTIVQNGNDVTPPINVPSYITNISNGAENQFCFTLNESDFGSTPPTGEFEFRLDAVFVYDNNGSPITFPISTTSAIPGPDVTFIDCNCCDDCCPNHHVVTEEVPTSVIHTKQAEYTLVAKNKINANITSPSTLVSYHAGDWVLLKPPFHAMTGSRVIAYIEGCAEFYQQKQIANSNSLIKNVQPRAIEEIELEKIVEINTQETFLVHPNPTKEFINISATNLIDVVIITDLNGRVVKQIKPEGIEVQVNISDLEQGVYILNATSNGKSFTQKIVKQ